MMASPALLNSVVFPLLINSSHLLLISYLSIWVWPWNPCKIGSFVSVLEIFIYPFQMQFAIISHHRILSGATILESNQTEVAQMPQEFVTLQIQRVSSPKHISHFSPAVCTPDVAQIFQTSVSESSAITTSQWRRTESNFCCTQHRK